VKGFSSGSSSGSSSSDGSKSNTGAIAGGVVGGVLGLLALVALFFFWRRRQRQRELQTVEPLREMGSPHSFNPEMLTRGDAQPFILQHPDEGSANPFGAGATESFSGGSGYGGGVGRPLPMPLSSPADGVPLSSKALMHLRHVNSGTPSDPSSLYSRAPASDSSAVSAGRAASSSAGSEGAATADLRAEVSLLRREMAQIREVGLDLPPTYE
jgi:hypothetical protein